MNRLLLPFTQGVDAHAIDCAIWLAHRDGAILVSLSLIRHSETDGARLEAIQQSKDFLEVVRHKARRMGVPVEQAEFYTHTPVESIHAFAQEMVCAEIMLFLRGGAGILLETEEVKYLLEQERIALSLVRLSAKGGLSSRARKLARWFQKSQQDQLLRIQNCFTNKEVYQHDIQTSMFE